MTRYAWSWEWRERDITLRVPHDTAAVWRAYRQRIWQRERGGQLFVRAEANGDLVLATATRPHPDDRASWTWLELNPARCAQEIKAENASGRRLVGTWHTHPQEVPVLSPTDVQSLRASAHANAALLPACLAVIVGDPRLPRGIRAWRVDASSIDEAVAY